MCGSYLSSEFAEDKKTTVKEPHRTPPKFEWGAILSILTTTIDVNMGRRLPNKVVHRIRIRIKANKDIATIIVVVKVAKKTIYKI